MKFPLYEQIKNYVLQRFYKKPEKIEEIKEPKPLDNLEGIFEPRLTKEGAIDLNFEPKYIDGVLVLPDEPKIRPH